MGIAAVAKPMAGMRTVNISSCAAVKVAASFADLDAFVSRDKSEVLYPSPGENHGGSTQVLMKNRGRMISHFQEVSHVNF